MNGGCDRVVGIGEVVGELCVGLSPIGGIVAVSAQWSLYLVFWIVIDVSSCLWLDEAGRRRSQWSSGVFAGRYVGVVGSPMCEREVVLQNVVRRVLWEMGCWAGVPWRSPPRRTGMSGCFCVSRVDSHLRVSWYDCLPSGVFDCGR